MFISDMLFRAGCGLDRLMYGSKFGSILNFAKDKDSGSDKKTGGENEWDFLSKKSNGGGAFDKLTTSIKSTGASFNEMLGAFAVSAILGAIIIYGIQLAVFKNGGKKQELKEHIPYILLGIVFAVGGTILFVIGKSIANGIQSSL